MQPVPAEAVYTVTSRILLKAFLSNCLTYKNARVAQHYFYHLSPSSKTPANLLLNEQLIMSDVPWVAFLLQMSQKPTRCLISRFSRQSTDSSSIIARIVGLGHWLGLLAWVEDRH